MAYTYTGTPSAAIDAAKRRISGNNAVAETALSSYMAMAEATQNEFADVQQEQKEEVGAFRRTAETFGDVVRNIFIGVGKAIEGVADFGASTLGIVAGWAGNDDLKQRASDWAEKDITTGISNSWIEHLNQNYGIDVSFSNSFINDMSERGQRIVRGVSQGVGQMLPLILTTVATGGASAVASAKGAIGLAKGLKVATKVGNMALLGMSAAGNATEEALNAEVYNEDGTKRKVSLDRAYLYGLASGAVEVATEMFVGGGFEKIFGGGIADKMISKLAKSTRFEKAVKFALNALGEGVEEVAAEAVSNTLKTIYNSDKGFHWEDPDVQAMFESGVIGTLTAAVLQGGDVAVRKTSNTMTVADTVVDLDNLERRIENMSSAETLDTETQTRLQAEYTKDLETLTKRFGKATEKQQKKMFLQNPSLSKFINEDGTLRHSAQLNEGVAEITQEQMNSPAMSQSLFNRTNEIANNLAQHSTTIAENLDGVQTENVRKLRTVLKKAGINNNIPLKVVVAENLADRNACIKDDVFVISKDRLNSIKDMARDLAHESTHFAEGTKEYGKLVDFLQDSLLGKKGTREYTFDDGSKFTPATLWEQAVMEVWENSTAGGRKNGYRISQETFDKILDGETDAKTDEARLAVSEIVAKASEYVFGDERIVNNLVEKDRSTAKAWLRKIKDTIKYIESAFKGDKETAATIRELHKAEKMFEDALASSGEKYLRGKVAENALKRELNGVDNSGETQYNNRYEPRDTSTVTQEQYNHHYWATNFLTDGELRQLESVVNNNIKTAFKTKDGLYMVAVGKDGVNNKIVFTDGGKSKYSINKIIEINLDNETELSPTRSDIYAYERDGIQYETGELFTIHASTDVNFYEWKQRNIGKNARDNNQLGSDGRRSRRTAKRITSVHFNEDGTTTYNYADGSVEQSNLRTKGDEAYIADAVARNTLAQQEFDRAPKRIKSIIEKRDNLKKLTEAEFNSAYFAHKVLNKSLNIDELTASIRKNGFESRTGVNVLSANNDNSNVMSIGYMPQANETVILVPSIWVNKDSKIIDGYKPLPFEIVKIEYTNQPYYEAYLRAYNEYFGIKENAVINKYRNLSYSDLLKMQEDLVQKAIAETDAKKGQALFDQVNEIKRYIRRYFDNDGVRYSLRDNKGETTTLPKNAEQMIKNHFGTTYNWREALYLTQEGDRIDGSGRKIGNTGNYGNRVVDHREISAAFSEDVYEGIYGEGNDFMIEFINRGNIRIMPESCGIELSVEPTQEQYRLIQDFAERIGFKERYFSVDISDTNGDVLETLTYDGYVSGRKIVSDIKYYFKEGKLPYSSDISRFHGDQASVRFTGEKHYTREEARKIINSIVNLRLVLDENTFGDLTNKSKKQIIDALWHGLNETPKGKQGKIALDVADYIIDNAIYDDQYENGALHEEDLRVVELLKPHLHSLNLKSIRAEIKHHYDKNNSVYLLWSVKEGGIGPDQLAMELAEQGFQFRSDNEADQFIQMAEAYSEATNRLKGNSQELLTEYMSDEQREELRQKIARDILLAFDKNGTPTMLANKLKKYERQIADLRKMVAEGKTYNNALNRVFDLANELKLENIKKFHNSSVLDDKVFTKIISGLGKIKYRSDLRKSSTRAILGSFASWYNVGNELLNGGLDVETAKKKLAADNAVGYLNGDIIFALDYFANDADNHKALDLTELREAAAILEHAKFILKNYDKVTLDNKQIVLSDTARNANTTASKFSALHKHTRIREALKTYGYNIVEPRVVFESMFGYEDNGLVQAFNDICAGETESGRIRLELILTVDAFMKEHKKYKKRLASDKITVSGHEISIGTALSLYMLSKQQASIDGLQKGGWGFRDKNGYFVECGVLTDGDIATIENSLSDTDKAFLKTAREFFDKGGEYMKATDKKIKGYSLISTENSDYFPIVRYSGDIAKSVEQNYMQAMSNASVQNMGITKQRVKNEKRIEVYDILSVMETHARQIGQYSGLAIPVKSFQQIYNCRIDGNISLKNTINEKTWKGFDNYVTNWLADVQGMGKIHTKIDSAVDAIRGAYAKYQLGANIKVVFSQLASYPTAFYYLSTVSMTKAFGHALNFKNTDATPFKLMDKYCAWAKVRNADKGIALAEGNLERLGEIGDVFTKPIQWTDRLTIGLLWNACQCEVERLHKGDASFKYGTEANMIEAGKLLEKVGRGTQPNYTAAERSALQRSNSQVAKTFSMFSSVPLKQISRLFEAFGRERALRYKKNVLKENVSAEDLKAAHKVTTKALTAVTVANVVYVLMGELIKTALKKDRKDKDGNEIGFVEDMFRDFLSTSVGMLPIIKDAYNVFFQQYNNTDFVSSGFNETLGSIRDIYDMVTKLGSGETYEASDIAKPLRALCYSLGQITGIPTRNIYNLVFGLTKRFDESAAYEWNSIFYSQNYTKDLKQAIEKGESDKATTIIGLMLKDDGMTSTSAQVNEKLRTLYASGYSVLPRTVSDKIVYNGEIIPLSQKSQKAFKEVYSEANKEVETLIRSKAFDGLNDEVQAKAIKWIYDYYYESAVYATVGEEANSKKQLFGETMSVSKFAMVVSACSMVEAKTDKKGNVINGSKKAEILKLLNRLSLSSGEKIMILAYLGYGVGEYSAAIRRYISKIGLSKTQQKALLEYCSL